MKIGTNAYSKQRLFKFRIPFSLSHSHNHHHHYRLHHHHHRHHNHHDDITRATRQRLCLQEPTQPKNETKRTSLENFCQLLSSCLWRISQTYKNIYLNNFSTKSSIKGCLPLINIKEESGFNAILCLPTPKLLPKHTREAAKRDRFYIWQYLGWLDFSKIFAGFLARF